MAKVYVGDTGTQINVLTKTDLEDMSNAELKVRITAETDQGTVVSLATWPASLKGLAKDGIIEHVSQKSDFAVAGSYAIAAHVTFTDGSEFTGETARLTVYDVFD